MTKDNQLHTRNNIKLLAAVADFNSNIQKVSLVHNGSFSGDKPKQPTVISCQFSAIPREGGSKKKQFKLGLGDCNWSQAGLELAKQRATKINLKLLHNEFTWQWFDEYIKGHKPVDEIAIALSTPIQVWIDKLYATKKGKIKERSWYTNYQVFYDHFYGKANRKPGETLTEFNKRKAKLAEEYKQKPFSEQLIRNCFASCKKGTNAHANHYRALSGLLKVANLYDHFQKLLNEYKPSTEPVTKQRNVPSDKRIKEIYYTGFPSVIRGFKKQRENPSKWQWLFGLLATYGLRIHEAWNIANWNKAVVLKGGQWVEASDKSERWQNQKDYTIPAFNSPKNTHHVLAISHETKTGYRLAYPLSPAGEDWVEEFKLKGELRLPEIRNPLGHEGASLLGSRACSNVTCRFFRSKKFGFTPHDLRHAYNHRGRVLGISITALALSLGHSEKENDTTYTKHMDIERKVSILEKDFFPSSLKESKGKASEDSKE